LYGYKTWFLTIRERHRLKVFERKAYLRDYLDLKEWSDRRLDNIA
jgi:hypothetical protein